MQDFDKLFNIVLIRNVYALFLKSISHVIYFLQDP